MTEGELAEATVCEGVLYELTGYGGTLSEVVES